LTSLRSETDKTVLSNPRAGQVRVKDRRITATTSSARLPSRLRSYTYRDCVPKRI
jgi:hypothetical protein